MGVQGRSFCLQPCVFISRSHVRFVCGFVPVSFRSYDRIYTLSAPVSRRSLARVISCVPPLIAMCRDHESLNLQQFEGLVALTNLASVDNVKARIITEKGISCFQYLQVKRLAIIVPKPGLCGLNFVRLQGYPYDSSLLLVT